MPARLSDALPRACTCAAAAAYSRAGPRAASPRPSHTARRRSTWQHGSRTSHAAPHEPSGRPIQARNNSWQYPLSPAGAKPLLSRADLLPGCYQEVLPSTRKHSCLYSNCFCDLGGAMGIRTPDLLHAMKATPSPPPAPTQRDQQKQRRGATQSDSEQRPPTLICYPTATQDTPAHRSPLTGHAAPPPAWRGQRN
jgi:hypothetical protein